MEKELNTHNELIIAGVVVLIMVAVIIFVVGVNNSKKDKNTNDLKVYVFKPNPGSKYEGVYNECNLTDSEYNIIYNAYMDARKLDGASRIPDHEFTGNYKIINGDEFIAFDGDEDYFYSSRLNILLSFKSDLYKTVIEACNATYPDNIKVTTEDKETK